MFLNKQILVKNKLQLQFLVSTAKQQATVTVTHHAYENQVKDDMNYSY